MGKKNRKGRVREVKRPKSLLSEVGVPAPEGFAGEREIQKEGGKSSPEKRFTKSQN